MLSIRQTKGVNFHKRSCIRTRKGTRTQTERRRKERERKWSNERKKRERENSNDDDRTAYVPVQSFTALIITIRNYNYF